MIQANKNPDALLLIAPGCPHCPAIMKALSELLKSGELARLDMVSIVDHPEMARQAGTRSVPWLRIGPFELEGQQTPAELRQWVEHARSESGAGSYLSQLLSNRKLDKATTLVRDNHAYLAACVNLIADLQTPMGVRIGIGAIFEELGHKGLLAPVVDELGSLTRSKEVQVRADAAHYLGLDGSAAAIAYLHPLLKDDNREVREIAAESLQPEE